MPTMMRRLSSITVSPTMKSLATLLLVLFAGHAKVAAALDDLWSLSSSLRTVPAVRRSSWTTQRTTCCYNNNKNMSSAQPCSITKTLARGAFLRIASDLSGGTPCESVKTRVTTTREGPLQAFTTIVREGGILALWTGTPSRMVEGALVGAVFMVASTVTKRQVKLMGGSPTVAALAGGLSGGIAQSIVMTPAGMIFTSLNYNRGKPGYENDNALSVIRRIVKEKGIAGMYYGSGPMALRQATNWASRAGFTEIARTTLGLSGQGVAGELASGVLGGLFSCWNTPIESVRVITQRDVGSGKEPKSMMEYWKEIVKEDGVPGLFRGITPRAVQAVWQTTFLVVFPNMMGL